VHAAAALSAAAEAAVNLTGVPRGTTFTVHSGPHIVVAQDVARTNDHRSRSSSNKLLDSEMHSQTQKENVQLQAIPICNWPFDFAQSRSRVPDFCGLCGVEN
jgi:formate dehydrogenase assembly factor FdhD